MALSDYVVPRTEIKIGIDNSMSVRGLALEDITFLVSVHKEDIDTLIEMFRAKSMAHVTNKSAPGGVINPALIDEMVRKSGDDLISGFLQQFPLLAANVIATACDEPESWQAARTLPLPLQIEALLSVAKLTFEDAEGFKKFVGNVAAVLRSASAQAPQIVSNSKKKSTKSTGSTD